MNPFYANEWEQPQITDCSDYSLMSSEVDYYPMQRLVFPFQ